MDDLEMYEEPEFDAETQERLDSQVSLVSYCYFNTNVGITYSDKLIPLLSSGG